MTQHLKPRLNTMVVYQGDDLDRLNELHLKVKIAERIANERTGAERQGDADGPRLVAARAEYEEFVTQAAERALEIQYQSIGRRRFRDLLMAHPPRTVQSEPDEGGLTKTIPHPDDEGWGVNTETFPMALLTFRDGRTRTIVQPDFGSSEATQDFLDDELSEGDFESLWIQVHLWNRSPSSDPKAEPSWNSSRSTSAISR